MNTRYSAAFQERAVRLVEKQQREGSTQWAAMQSISKELGCMPETLRRGFGNGNETRANGQV